MGEFLKSIINKNEVFSIISKAIYYRKDKKQLYLMNNLKTASDIIQVLPKKNAMGKPPFIFIEAGQANGMGSCIRAFLEGLYFCDMFGFIPYIRMVDSLYYDVSMPKDMNPFEYYFTQPTDFTLEMLKEYPQVIYCPGRRTKARELNEQKKPYSITDNYIQSMGQVWHKFLRMNETTEQFISQRIDLMDITDHTLGVHIRGTDFKKKYRNHPKYVEPFEYFPFIDEALKKYEYRRIYLATDDDDILDEFIANYGNKICFSKETTRSRGKIGVHRLGGINSNISPYKIGLEVLSDIAILASCGGIICGLSQVSICARIFKASKLKKYSYEKIIMKGINKTGENLAGYRYHENDGKTGSRVYFNRKESS